MKDNAFRSLARASIMVFLLTPALLCAQDEPDRELTMDMPDAASHLQTGQTLRIIGPFPTNQALADASARAARSGDPVGPPVRQQLIIIAVNKMGAPEHAWQARRLFTFTKRGFGGAIIYDGQVVVYDDDEHPDGEPHDVTLLVNEADESGGPTEIELELESHSGTGGYHGGTAHLQN